MRRQAMVIIVLALVLSVALGFLIGQLAGGDANSPSDWTPAPTTIATPVSPTAS